MTGAAGALTCPCARSARAYAGAMALLYMAAALCSVVTGATVFGVIRVDALGSADHAFEAIVLAVVWLAARANALNRVPSSSKASPEPG